MRRMGNPGGEVGLTFQGVLKHLRQSIATAIERHLLLARSRILGKLEVRVLLMDGANQGVDFFLHGLHRGLQGVLL